MRGLAAAQYVLAFKIFTLNYKRIAGYAREQIRKQEKKTRTAPVTPLRPEETTTRAKKAAEKKIRSRDRDGWSNYRRNAKKINGVTDPPDNAA